MLIRKFGIYLSCAKDEDENVLMEKDQIKRRRTECINGLIQITKDKRPAIQKQMTGNPIRRDEIRDAMKQMKRNKAVGKDEIAFEMI